MYGEIVVLPGDELLSAADFAQADNYGAAAAGTGSAEQATLTYADVPALAVFIFTLFVIDCNCVALALPVYADVAFGRINS